MIFDQSKLNDARDLIKIAAKQFNGYEITPSEIDTMIDHLKWLAIDEDKRTRRTA
jgi:hypothetical protein